MKKIIKSLFTAVAMIALAAAPGFALVTTIYPSEDSYVDSSNPTVNDGANAFLVVANSGGIYYHSFMKFSSVQIPAGTINSAILYVNNAYSYGNPYLLAKACTANWAEMTINYNNMPGVTGSGASCQIYDTTTGYYPIDITAIVNSWKSGPNYGLRIETTGIQMLTYSREAGSTTMPYLVIDYSGAGGPTATPTPITGAITLPEAVDNLGYSFTTGGSGNWFGQSATSYYGGDAARSGAIGNSASTYMQTTVTGPGSVSFFWSVSSESCCDHLYFYVDGISQGHIEGSVGWTQVSAWVGAGTHTLRWEYSKDGSVATGSDCGWVDQFVFTSGTPTFTPTRTITMTNTVSPTFSNTRTISPTWSISPTWTVSPTVTNTRTATPTSSQTATPVYATVPFLDGFESGNFSQYWQTYTSNTYGRIQVTSANVPYAGAYHALMDSNVSGYYALEEMILYINLAGIPAPMLSYQIENFNDEYEPLPSSFTGHYNGDGISISQDGTNWYTITSINTSYNVYTAYTFSLEGYIVSAGITDRSHIRIKFQHYDDYQATTDGFAFDNIQVYTVGTPTATPTISPTWSATPTRTATATITCTATGTYTASPVGTPTLEIVPIPEAVDNYTLSWSLGGSAQWFGQNQYYMNGGDSAKSGGITDNQSSYMQTQVTGPGTLTFSWSVSSEYYYDRLLFYVDGVEQEYISGAGGGWSQRSYYLNPGTHTIRWGYVKDSSDYDGLDCGWVDNISYVQDGATPVPTVWPTFSPTPAPTAPDAPFLGSYVYPLPASNHATFVYGLKKDAEVKIIVYNVAGMDVTVLTAVGHAGNNNKAYLDLSGFAPGTYYYTIKIDYRSEQDMYKPAKFLVVK